jgi:hypothetical protein
MVRFKTLPVLVVAGLLALTACRVPAETDRIPAEAVRVPGTDMETLIDEWNTDVDEPARLVIADTDSWARFWSDVHRHQEPAPEPPAIDFEQRLVLAAAMGQRPSGGYQLVIEEVAAADGRLYAAVLERSPGATCMTADVITAPVHAVAVPATDAAVTWIERQETYECE